MSVSPIMQASGLRKSSLVVSLIAILILVTSVWLFIDHNTNATLVAIMGGAMLIFGYI